jgi:hydrogenase maturation protease
MIREVGFMEAGVSSASGEAPILRVVPELRIGEERFQTGLEAVERRVEVPSIRLDPAKPLKHEIRFQFPKNRTLQPIVREEMVVGLIRRRQEAVRGTIEITADPVGPRLLRVTIRVLNHTWVPPINPDEADPVLLQTLASTHAILHVQGGDFVSLVAPAPQHRHATRLCRNIGTWPVLVGSPSLHERDTLLSSPVMLYDYPTIATEYPPLPFSVSTSQGTACNLPDHQGENQPRRVPPLRSVSASRGRCRIEGKDGRRKFGPDNNGRSL